MYICLITLINIYMKNEGGFPSIDIHVKDSITFYKNNYKKLVPLGLIVVVSGLIVQLITSPLALKFETGGALGSISGWEIGLSIVVIMVLSLAGVFLQWLSLIATIKAVRNCDVNEDFTFTSIIKDSIRLVGPFLWVGILTALVVIIPAIFLFVPGMVVGIYLSFSSYALIVDDKRGLSSLSTSLYYVKGNFWQVLLRYIYIGLIVAFVAIVILFGGSLIAYLTVGNSNPDEFVNLIKSFSETSLISTVVSIIVSIIISILTYCVIIPLTTIYSYIMYKSLKRLKPEQEPETEAKQTRVWLKVLSIGGAVVYVVIPIIMLVGVTLLVVMSKNINNSESIPAANLTESYFPDNALTLPQRTESLETTPYTNKELGFSINFPKGWVVDYNGEDVYAAKDLVGDVDSSISIEKIPQTRVLSAERELELMNNVAYNILNNNEINLKYVNYNRYNINSLNSYLVSGSMMDGDREVNVNFYYIVNGSDIFLVTQTAEVSIWSRIANIFVNSVNTFKVI